VSEGFLVDDFPSNEDTEAVIVEARLVFYSKNLSRDMHFAQVDALLEKMKFYDSSFTRSECSSIVLFVCLLTLCVCTAISVLFDRDCEVCLWQSPRPRQEECRPSR
jgi:hypothetical protein